MSTVVDDGFCETSWMDYDCMDDTAFAWFESVKFELPWE